MAARQHADIQTMVTQTPSGFDDLIRLKNIASDNKKGLRLVQGGVRSGLITPNIALTRMPRIQSTSAAILTVAMPLTSLSRALVNGFEKYLPLNSIW